MKWQLQPRRHYLLRDKHCSKSQRDIFIRRHETTFFFVTWNSGEIAWNYETGKNVTSENFNFWRIPIASFENESFRGNQRAIFHYDTENHNNWNFILIDIYIFNIKYLFATQRKLASTWQRSCIFVTIAFNTSTTFPCWIGEFFVLSKPHFRVHKKGKSIAK